MNLREAHEMATRAAKSGIRMTFSTATPRKEPKAGDRRTTKKHGEQVRVHVVHNGMLVMTGGHRRYAFEWVSVTDFRATAYAPEGTT